VLIIDGSAVDEGLARAARNLPKVDVLPQQGAMSMTSCVATRWS